MEVEISMPCTSDEETCNSRSTHFNSFLAVIRSPVPVIPTQEVKIGAEEMVKNLHFKNGTAIIPRGSLVSKTFCGLLNRSYFVLFLK